MAVPLPALRRGSETPAQNVKQGWGGCRTCGRAASSVRQRGPEATAINLMRAAGLEPLEPYQNVMTPWRSQCQSCGKEVSPLLNNIRNGQGGCAWCAHGAVDPDEAASFMRAAGLEPLTAYPGRASPWPCRCQCCHQTVSPRYGAVRNGSGCRYCNDTAIKPGAAAALMRAAGLEPLKPYPGSLRRWACRCAKCGRTVQPCYSTVQRGSGGCRWCRNSGFKSGEAATVYLITHARYSSAKIGITDAAGNRVSKHRQHGWQVLTTVRVPGELALAIEKESSTGGALNWPCRSTLAGRKCPKAGGPRPSTPQKSTSLRRFNEFGTWLRAAVTRRLVPLPQRTAVPSMLCLQVEGSRCETHRRLVSPPASDALFQ